MDEIKIIQDQLYYDIFLAEETMRMSLRQLDEKAKCVTEASEIIVLNESVAEVIRTYIKKVAASIQKAWNTFKAKIDYKIIRFVIDNNKKYLESDFKMKLPDDYEYPEINVWKDINQNCSVGDNLLTSSNYAQMSEYLESTEKFLQQYYPNFVEQENGEQMRMIDVFMKRCFTKATNQQVVERRLISEFVSFLDDYQNQIEMIQEDIDAINNVSQNIDQLLRQVTGEATEYIGNIILEAEDTNKFRNADPNAEEKTKSNNKDRQNIVTYYKAMTQLLTAKMRTCNKVKSNALRIVTNFVRLQGGLVKIPEKNKENK